MEYFLRYPESENILIMVSLTMRETNCVNRRYLLVKDYHPLRRSIYRWRLFQGETSQHYGINKKKIKEGKAIKVYDKIRVEKWE